MYIIYLYIYIHHTYYAYTAAIPFITQPARQTKFVCSGAYACDVDGDEYT